MSAHHTTRTARDSEARYGIATAMQTVPDFTMPELVQITALPKSTVDTFFRRNKHMLEETGEKRATAQGRATTVWRVKPDQRDVLAETTQKLRSSLPRPGREKFDRAMRDDFARWQARVCLTDATLAETDAERSDELAAAENWLRREEERLDVWARDFEIPAYVVTEMERLNEQVASVRDGVDKLCRDLNGKDFFDYAIWMDEAVRCASNGNWAHFAPFCPKVKRQPHHILLQIVNWSDHSLVNTPENLTIAALSALANAEREHRNILCRLLQALGDKRIESALRAMLDHRGVTDVAEAREIVPVVLVALIAMPPLLNPEQFPLVRSWFDRCRYQPYWSNELAPLWLSGVRIGNRVDLRTVAKQLESTRSCVEDFVHQKRSHGRLFDHFKTADKAAACHADYFVSLLDSLKQDDTWLSPDFADAA